MRIRIAVLAAAVVAAGAIVTAIAIHRAVVSCAYLACQPAGSACPQSADYPLHLRLGIAAAGLIAAALIALIGGGVGRRGRFTLLGH
jgi:hypothetical protein